MLLLLEFFQKPCKFRIFQKSGFSSILLKNISTVEKVVETSIQVPRIQKRTRLVSN
jgi:ribosomal protein L32E